VNGHRLALDLALDGDTLDGQNVNDVLAGQALLAVKLHAKLVEQLIEIALELKLRRVSQSRSLQVFNQVFRGHSG
jgi:hypothetical protein